MIIRLLYIPPNKISPLYIDARLDARSRRTIRKDDGEWRKNIYFKEFKNLNIMLR
jgi:hypothetical protein